MAKQTYLTPEGDANSRQSWRTYSRRARELAQRLRCAIQRRYSRKRRLPQAKEYRPFSTRPTGMELPAHSSIIKKDGVLYGWILCAIQRKIFLLSLLFRWRKEG